MKEKKRKINLLNNWAYKLFSIVAAFLLWLLVMTIEDPESQKIFYNIPVKLVNTEELTDKDMVYEILDKTDVVRSVTITAKKTIRDELSSSDIVAEADFSKLTAADTVEITFYSLRYNDEITAIAGSNEILKLNIEDKKTRRLSVTVTTTGEVEEGYIINSISPDQNRIEVSGPESVVSQIATANVKVDVTDSVSDISTYADVVLYDADGKEIAEDRLTMNVGSVRVKVEILNTKTVPVRFSVTGTPVAEYLFTGEITATPDRVLIAGTNAVLDSVNEIVVPAEVINITGQTSDMTTSVNITKYLPEGIILGDKSFNGKISVTAHIEKEAVRELEIPAQNITFTNVPEGYAIETDNTVVVPVVNIKGLQADVNAVDANTVYGVVDMEKFMEERNWNTLGTGLHEATVEVTLPEAVTQAEPVKILILISMMEEQL